MFNHCKYLRKHATLNIHNSRGFGLLTKDRLLPSL